MPNHGSRCRFELPSVVPRFESVVYVLPAHEVSLVQKADILDQSSLDQHTSAYYMLQLGMVCWCLPVADYPVPEVHVRTTPDLHFLRFIHVVEDRADEPDPGVFFGQVDH